MQRTYSRKHRRRHIKDSESSSDESPERGPSPPRHKRRRTGIGLDPNSPADPAPVQRRNATTLKPDGASSRRQNGVDKVIPPSSNHTDVLANSAKPSRTRSPSSSAASSATPLRRPAETGESRSKEQSPFSQGGRATKDLSSLFDFSTSSSSLTTQPPGKGVAKRMLRRAQTDSAITLPTLDRDQPEFPQHKLSSKKTEIFESSAEHPTIGSSTPPSRISKSLEDMQPSTARPPLAASGSNLRTYGGKSRSFLVALPTSDQVGVDGLSAEPSHQDDFIVRESYDELRARWGVDNVEDDPSLLLASHASPGEKTVGKGKSKQEEVPVPPLPPGMMNDLKSITELRSKGESRRFMDDMGYLLEGLDAEAPLGVRRGSAMEIVTKLCDIEFSRKAKTTDFLGRAWDTIWGAGGGNGDKVLGTILAFFSALIARDPRDLSDIAEATNLVSTLFSSLGVLDKSNDPLWLLSCSADDTELKRHGIAKVDRTSLLRIHSLITHKSGLFSHERAISNRLLISYALSTLPPRLLRCTDLGAIVDAFAEETSPLSSRITAYAAGLPLVPPLAASSRMDTFSIIHIDNCLRLLDSYLLGQWAGSDEDYAATNQCLRNHQLGTSLVASCTAVNIVLHDPELSNVRLAAHGCLESIFRVIINLTHDSPSRSGVLLKDLSGLHVFLQVVMSSHWQRQGLTQKLEQGNGIGKVDELDMAAQLLDRLCLALGVLTNMIQHDAAVSTKLREIELNPHCASKRGCVIACHCATRLNGFQCLSLVYKDLCNCSTEVDVVVRGHIAVLFGLFMKQGTQNRRALLESLPGTTDKKIYALLNNAQEFATFYTALASKAADIAETLEDEDTNEENAESQGVGFSRIVHDKQGESVARDVVTFLTELRDGIR